VGLQGSELAPVGYLEFTDEPEGEEQKKTLTLTSMNSVLNPGNG